MIQVTLKKMNGSFGMVIRGGFHDIPAKRRPFTVYNITAGGPTDRESTIRYRLHAILFKRPVTNYHFLNHRVNDRIKSINGMALHGMKLPDLQSLIYRQEGETKGSKIKV